MKLSFAECDNYSLEYLSFMSTQMNLGYEVSRDCCIKNEEGKKYSSILKIFIILTRVVGTGGVCFGGERNKIHLEFYHFAGLLNVARPLILMVCYSPVDPTEFTSI